MPLSQTLLNLGGGGEDVRDVRLFGFAQGRRDADDDGVAVGQVVEVGGRAQAFGGDEFADDRRGHVADVGLARVDRRGLLLVHLEAGGEQTFARELGRQRQAHVAEADDADARLALLDAFDDVVFNHAESVSRGVKGDAR